MQKCSSQGFLWSTAHHLLLVIIQDSQIAKKYSCARTKTTNIVRCLAHDDAENLAGRMKNEKYSIATDSSTDLGSNKLYLLVVKTFDNNKGE